MQIREGERERNPNHARNNKTTHKIYSICQGENGTERERGGVEEKNEEVRRRGPRPAIYTA